VHLPTDAVPDELLDDRETGLLRVLLDRRRDVAQAPTRLRLLDPDGERLLCDLDEPTSAQKPSRTRPRSRLTMSPDCSRREPGMPWTASSLTDTQIELGKP
jgi:hypothetical protein